jgi:hypothetical protein
MSWSIMFTSKASAAKGTAKAAFDEMGDMPEPEATILAKVRETFEMVVDGYPVDQKLSVQMFGSQVTIEDKPCNSVHLAIDPIN